MNFIYKIKNCYCRKQVHSAVHKPIGLCNGHSFSEIVYSLNWFEDAR